ncbi:PEP-CTERM protein-sorting domain-containing protein [Parasphingorhabdus marina DSM 22363]|uniref:PEP-CTERM protein-sorting domain-containing protein n=1 Tax=Parasphingorhabdus marina DSM 22363 TaxID=1123272 RepID=A0A1N6H0Y8_9SPHN|nr:PEPxxWA-CTERM sorting domain-containing protein [Parasphingorhabdus marina]SIO13488.1 PEP-CTERM protein-sorting domain-containing protein [Parasphingorhabdus marina DSM 22363]
MRILSSAIAFSAAAFALSSAANAAIIINIQESGSDVVGTATGTLDLTGLTDLGTIPIRLAVRGTPGYFGGGSNGAVQAYTGITGPANWGPGSLTDATSSSGDMFAFNPRFSGSPRVFVPIGYTSNSAISSSSTFAGETLASLGLTEGTYLYNAPNDTITVIIGNVRGAVPEPATWAFMILGFGAIGGAMRRQKNTARKANVKVSYA